MSQIQEYADWRNQQETKAIQNQRIQHKWMTLFQDTPESGVPFPWGEVRGLLEEHVSLDEISDAFVESYEDMQGWTEEKAIACKNILMNEVKDFLDKKQDNEKQDDEFSEYINQLESIDKYVKTEDLYTGRAKEIIKALQQTEHSKRKRRRARLLGKKDQSLGEISIDEIVPLSESEKILREKYDNKASSKQLRRNTLEDVAKREQDAEHMRQGFSPRTELRYLSQKREQYKDYLTIDVPQYGVMRSYYQMKSNLRYMYDADFIHFPSHHEAYQRLEDAWSVRKNEQGKTTKSHIIHLQGPTGSGKTEMAKQFLEKKTKKPSIIIKCDPDMMSADVYGKYQMKGTNDAGNILFEFIKDGLQKGAEEGRGVILDEFDKLPGDLKGPINGLYDLMQRKGTTTEVQGDGGSKMTIHHDWMVIATSNYGPQYSASQDKSDISTQDRMFTVRLGYLTERELGYQLLSKSMNRKTLEIQGDEAFQSILSGLPKVMNNIAETINQRSTYRIQNDTSLQEAILKIKPISFRGLQRRIEMVQKGRGTLKELLDQTINQYEMDQQVQKLFVLSLLLDAKMINGFAQQYPNDVAKLTGQKDLIKRIGDLQGKDDEIDEIMRNYVTWYDSLEERPEKTYRANALDFALTHWHKDDIVGSNGTERRDNKWDELIGGVPEGIGNDIQLVETVIDSTRNGQQIAFEELAEVLSLDTLEEHQNNMVQRAESQDEASKLLAVINKARQHLEDGTVKISQYNGYIETIDTTTGRAYRHDPMKAHPNWTAGDYDEGLNAFKRLSTWSSDSDRSHWFYDSSNVKDIPLVYKGAIDGAHNEVFAVEFQQMLKEDIYNKGYERCTREQYEKSMNELFPGMSESEQILGMSFITGQQGRYWFQQLGECSDIGDFNNKSNGQYRSCIGSLANDRGLDSWSSNDDDMAILPSRSVSGI